MEELPIDEHRDKSLGDQKWVINGPCMLLEYIYIYYIIYGHIGI